ncbi:MAG: glycosyltransferase WbuB [Nitrospinota bacterium]|nr:MAG: glycosyltransferase WbuB [Nitrospinota bacterium]
MASRRGRGIGCEMKGRVVKVVYQTYLPYQGRYPRISGQAKILQENGFEVVILACDREGTHPPQEVVEGIPVQRIPVQTGEMRGPLRQLFPLLLFWIRALKMLRTWQFDLLHCHNLDVLPLGYLVKLCTGRPVLFDAHEPDYYALWPERWRFLLSFLYALERTLARRVDGVSVTNEYQVQKYRKAGVRHVELIGNYPLPHLRLSELPVEKFARETVTFGRLGTIYPAAGFEETIAAFRQISLSYPQVRLLLAGRVVENYQQTFFQLIQSLQDRVEFIGAYPAEKMPELYHRMDVSLLVYPRSPWFRHITPRKFFDSLANGVPVIMTDIGGLGKCIQAHNCGLVVNEEEIESIVQAMRRLIEDKGLRKTMAHNALHLAQTEFDWQAMARRYVTFQHRLLAQGRKA